MKVSEFAVADSVLRTAVYSARPETNPDHHEHEEEEETIDAPNIDAVWPWERAPQHC